MTIGIVSYINPYELKEFFDFKEIPNTNAMASSVQALVSGLISLGHDVIVFSPASIRITRRKKYIILNGSKLKIYLISTIPSDFLIRHLYLPKRIAKLVEKELDVIDVLHAHWTYECSAAVLPFVIKKPVFCSVRDWWPVQYLFFKKKGLIERIKWGCEKRIMFNKTMNEKRIRFIANSEYTRKQILTLFPDYSIPIIPNPIMGKYINLEYKYKYNGVFVSVANSLLEDRKNITSLLKAFASFHNTHENTQLLLIGDYSVDNPMYHEWVQQELLDGVEFCGRLSHDQVIKQLDRASVMIHPSLEETFGNILLEGMARQLLVVGGRESGAVPSVLGYGEYGLLCDVEDYQSIYAVMCDLSKKEGNYGELVQRAVHYLEMNYSEIAVAKLHEKLYRSIV